ncbi:MAG: YwiC-like family protein [Candidatus Kryptoniota bacterium]
MKFKRIIPHEHGAWAMWIVPMLSALLVTKFTSEFLFLFFSFAFLYIAHHSVVTLINAKKPELKKEARTATIFFGVPGITLGVITIIVGRLWLLLIFGLFESILFIISVRSFTEKEQRTFFNELLVVAALTISAPAAYYSTTGTVDIRAVSLYIFNFLFFGSSVFYVKMRIEFLKSKGIWDENAKRARNLTIIYHSLMLITIFLVILNESVAVTVLLGFVPMIIQVIAGLFSRTPRVNFTKLGIGLVLQSAIFLSAIALFWH